MKTRKWFVLCLVLISMLLLMPSLNAYNYQGYRWDSATANWRFSIDFPSGYKQAVKNAANTWNNGGSVYRFNYRWWELYNKFDWSDLGSLGPLATTNVYGSGTADTSCDAGGSNSRAVTEVNNRKSWTTSPGQNYPPFDVETNALHEFGHWLILGHAGSGPVMYWDYEGTKRSLTSDDENGIQCIYGT